MNENTQQHADNVVQHTDNVQQHGDNVQQHRDNVQQGTDDEQFVRVQRWVVRLSTHLLFVLALGATCSIVLLVAWMVALNRATNEIKEHQISNRVIIEKNQEVILDNQKAILKAFERHDP